MRLLMQIVKGGGVMKWQHIQYENGSNPYICKTEKEFKRLKRKYGKRLQQIQEGFWIVREL